MNKVSTRVPWKKKAECLKTLGGNSLLVEALLQIAYGPTTLVQKEVQDLLAQIIRFAYNLNPLEPVVFHKTGPYWIDAGRGRSLRILEQENTLKLLAKKIARRVVERWF